MPRASATKAKKTRVELSTGRIALAALALVDEEGLEGFSFRVLAKRLGCEAMSLYHYYPSKAHLFDAMLEVCINEIRIPDETLAWRDRLSAIAQGFRGSALRHPGFFPYFAVHRLNTRAGLGLLNSLLLAFEATGLNAGARARSFRGLGYYIMGAGLDEAIGYAKGPSAAEPVPDEVVARDYPAVAAVGPYFTQAHHQATFEHGLKVLLDGIENQIAQQKGAGP
jgi:AcrR family transcriptional regulator